MPIDTTTSPHAVKPIRDFLTKFTPVQKSIPNPAHTTLTYDILNWSFAPTKPPPGPNTIYGSLTIQCEQRKTEITYHIHQQTHIGGEPTILNADIICNLDNTLNAWTLNTHRADANGDPIPISELRENWKNNNGHIHSQDGVYEYHATHPVLSLWTLPHILMRETLSLPTTFDMLQDLSLFRPHQTLTDDGSITLNSGTYKTYAQTGEGILPIHYLLDNQRKPQLITFGLIAWSLTDIS